MKTTATAAAIALAALQALSADLRLGWSPLPDTNNIGVRVYYGRSSFSGERFVSAPPGATTLWASNVFEGINFFFATAYVASGPSAGIEGNRSAEITWTNRSFGFSPTNVVVVIGTGGVASATVNIEMSDGLAGPWQKKATITASNLDLVDQRFLRGRLEITR